MIDEFGCYHLLSIRIDGEWFKLNSVFNENEFETFMKDVEWQLPLNMSIYHFSSALYPPLVTNPIIINRPTLDISPHSFIFEGNKMNQKIYYSKNNQVYEFIYEKGDFGIILSSGCKKLIYLKSKEWKTVQSYQVVPISFNEAKHFVNKHHRHNKAPQGHKFSIGLQVGGEIVGVLITSTPKARHLNNGRTLELNRCCVEDSYFNACSILYSRAIRAGKAMGYTKFISYTLDEEDGGSLRAVGFIQTATVKSRASGWSSKQRERDIRNYPIGVKKRWTYEVTQEI